MVTIGHVLAQLAKEHKLKVDQVGLVMRFVADLVEIDAVEVDGPVILTETLRQIYGHMH